MVVNEAFKRACSSEVAARTETQSGSFHQTRPLRNHKREAWGAPIFPAPVSGPTRMASSNPKEPPKERMFCETQQPSRKTFGPAVLRTSFTPSRSASMFVLSGLKNSASPIPSSL